MNIYYKIKCTIFIYYMSYRYIIYKYIFFIYSCCSIMHNRINLSPSWTRALGQLTLPMVGIKRGWRGTWLAQSVEHVTLDLCSSPALGKELTKKKKKELELRAGWEIGVEFRYHLTGKLPRAPSRVCHMVSHLQMGHGNKEWTSILLDHLYLLV